MEAARIALPLPLDDAAIWLGFVSDTFGTHLTTEDLEFVDGGGRSYLVAYQRPAPAAEGK